MSASGFRRQPVTVQRPAGGGRNDFGEPAPGWETALTVWASVTPLAGRELWLAQQAQSDATVTVRFPWSSAVADLAATWRLVHDGRTYEIAAPPRNLRSRGREWEVDCRESPDAAEVPGPPDMGLGP